MPTTTRTSRATKTGATKAAAKAVSGVPAQPSAAPVSAPPAGDSVRYINGLAVVSDEPVSSGLPVRPGRPAIPIHGIRVLTLEDDSVVYGCRDCDVVDTRGEIQKHRYRKHGAGKPGRKPASQAGDPPVSHDLAAMTLGDIIELARDAGCWGDMFAAAEARAETQRLADNARIEEWRSRALLAEAWRRRIVARLAPLGFKLDEEDQ